MTFHELIKEATAQLTTVAGEFAYTEVCVIIESLFNIDRARLLTMLHEDASDSVSVSMFWQYIRRRLASEPLAYILGKATFMGYDFLVSKGVLIPRSETELLVNEIVTYSQESNNESPIILELGFGSGCIALSLALKLSNAIIYAWDVSKVAFDVASENQQRLGCTNVHLYNKDFLNDESQWSGLCRPHTIFVSNPPYIPSSDILELDNDVKLFEPNLALDGGADGLQFYRECLMRLSKYQVPQFYEIGIEQRDDIVNIANQLGGQLVKEVKDYQGIPRVLQIR